MDENEENKKRILSQLGLRENKNKLFCKHNSNRVCIECMSGIVGNVSGITGNVSDIWGSVSGINCEVSDIIKILKEVD